jgi:hypothetical protein
MRFDQIMTRIFPFGKFDQISSVHRGNLGTARL